MSIGVFCRGLCFLGGAFGAGIFKLPPSQAEANEWPAQTIQWLAQRRASLPQILANRLGNSSFSETFLLGRPDCAAPLHYVDTRRQGGW